MYRDKQGNPLTLLQWADLFEDPLYKVVAQEIVGKYFISTVWLGLEQLGGLYFETMVFDRSHENKQPWYCIEMERYCTIEEAAAGHKEIVKKYEEEIKCN